MYHFFDIVKKNIFDKTLLHWRYKYKSKQLKIKQIERNKKLKMAQDAVSTAEPQLWTVLG